MRIAINCRVLIPNRLEGIGWYIYETTKRMIENHPEDTFILLYDRKNDHTFFPQKNAIELYIPPMARHPILYRLWFDYMIPWKLKKHSPDVFVSMDGMNSGRLKVPSYLMIHDLAYLHYPQYIDAIHLAFYEKNTPRFISNADGLGTVSNYSRSDLAKNFNLNPENIDVIPNGCRPVFRKLSADEKREVRQSLGIKKPYFIYTGSIHPRKNCVNLIRAYNHFRFRSPLEHELVIVGRMAWMNDLFERELENSPFKKQIHLTGYVGDEKLAGLLGAAEALVYPSLFEGFGVPLLEAMNAEVPIITSKNSSLPEVAGEAAVLVDPKNPQDIGRAMQTLAKNQPLRKKLIDAGIKRRKMYHWDKSAKMLYSAIKRTAHKQR
nr:glycosyltransferase family 4 protein [Saprospiraceae bacterium]